MKKFVNAFVILVLLLALISVPAFAQSGCQYATIVDESNTLDEASICQAAKPLAQSGVVVFIYYTNKEFPYDTSNPGNELNEWYTHLDQVEQDYNMWGKTDRLLDLLAFESTPDVDFSTMTEGGNIAAGKVETYSGDIIAILKGKIEQGKPTEGFVAALEKAYAVAYAPQATQAPATQVPPTPVPTKAPAFTEAQKEKIGNTFVTLFFVAMIGALIFFIVFIIIIPMKKRNDRIAKWKNQEALLRTRILELKGRCLELLGDDTKLSLKKMWVFMGGDKLPKQNAEVNEHIRVAGQVLAEMTNIVSTFPSKVPDDEAALKNLVSTQEQAYWLFTGSNEKTLKMTQSDIDALMDPTSVFSPEDQSDPLIVLAHNLYKSSAGSGVEIKMMTVFPVSTDTKGILGRIIAVKELMATLGKAKKSTPDDISGASSRRKEAGASTKLPFGLNDKSLFAYPDQLIESAKTLSKAGDWIEAKESAKQASDAYVKIPQVAKALNLANADIKQLVVPGEISMTKTVVESPIREVYQRAIASFEAGDYTQAERLASDVCRICERFVTLSADFKNALAFFETKKQKIALIDKNGFVSSAPTWINEAYADITIIINSLAVGDYNRAAEYIRELDDDSDKAVTTAQTLVKNYEANTASLTDLSTRVADAFIALKAAEILWDEISKYPESNWGGKDDHLLVASDLALQKLFDNPENPDDLVSRIHIMNETKREKSVQKATEDIAAAYRTLLTILKDVSDITVIHETLMQAKKNVPEAIRIAQQEDKRVDAYIKANSKFIDSETESKYAQIWKLMSDALIFESRLEFVKANENVAKARIAINQVERIASAQVSKLNLLQTELVAARTIASSSFKELVSEFDSFPGAMKTLLTEQQIATVRQAFSTLELQENQLSSLEDERLQVKLSFLISQYNELTNDIELASNQVNEDRAEYNKTANSVVRAIDDATSAISIAARARSDSDADDAGRNALQKAQDLKPEYPDQFDTLADLKQKLVNANESKDYAETANKEAEERIEINSMATYTTGGIFDDNSSDDSDDDSDDPISKVFGSSLNSLSSIRNTTSSLSSMRNSISSPTISMRHSSMPSVSIRHSSTPSIRH